MFHVRNGFCCAWAEIIKLMPKSYVINNKLNQIKFNQSIEWPCDGINKIKYVSFQTVLLVNKKDARGNKVQNME